MNFSMIARRRLRALGLLLDVLDAELAARGAELANAVGLRGVRMPVMSGMKTGVGRSERLLLRAGVGEKTRLSRICISSLQRAILKNPNRAPWRAPET